MSGEARWRAEIPSYGEPALRPDLEQVAAEVRFRLGEDVFDSAWAVGGALTLDQEIACALEEAKDVQPATQ